MFIAACLRRFTIFRLGTSPTSNQQVPATIYENSSLATLLKQRRDGLDGVYLSLDSIVEFNVLLDTV